MRISARLADEHTEMFQELMARWNTGPTETLTLLLLAVQDVPAIKEWIAAGRRLGDLEGIPLGDQVPVVGRSALKGMAQLGVLEGHVGEMAHLLVSHFRSTAWAIPLPCSLGEAVEALVGEKTRLPDAYLQAVFPSFWYAANGPAARARDPEFWAQVLRYPCGLNTTGEVYKEITLASLRRSCRVQRKTVSWFPAARAFKVYEEHLTPRKELVRIWDPSGGFGARMLAAAAWSKKHEVPVTYMACEPASMTRSDLLRLGAALERLSGHRFTVSISPQGSEHGGPGGTSFDLVFTSPPYFNTERYFEEPGQCWRDYPKWEQWKGSYLRPTVETAKAVLRPGGKLVLNVKQDASTWADAIGDDVGIYGWPVKAGPFARARGQSDLNEHLLVWEKP